MSSQDHDLVASIAMEVVETRVQDGRTRRSESPLMESAAAVQRSENARLAAKAARAEARAVLEGALRMRQSSREVSALAARSSAVGAAVRAAFAALPAPAALLDESGLVLAVNPAWRRCDAVKEAIAVGTAFGPTWTL